MAAIGHSGEEALGTTNRGVLQSMVGVSLGKRFRLHLNLPLIDTPIFSMSDVVAGLVNTALVSLPRHMAVVASAFLPSVIVSDKTLFAELESLDATLYGPYLASHWHIPLIAVTLYGVLVVGLGQLLMRHRTAFELRGLSQTWNAIVSMFSIAGAVQLVPYAVTQLGARGGVMGATCTPSTEWYMNGTAGALTHTFMWSKFFELVDTVFLVLRKKDVIFLHWYHHITVLLFCWETLQVNPSYGFWFCAMNYTVHAIMYSYYFLMGIGATRRLVRPIAPLITSMQILQMVGGLVVLGIVMFHPALQSASCAGGLDRAAVVDNMTYGLVMYFSYLVLFVHFFFRQYIAKGRPLEPPSRAASPNELKSRHRTAESRRS